MIFHLGGNTFDVSLLVLISDITDVLAYDKDIYLGGEVFDNRILDYLLNEIKKEYEKDIINNKLAIQILKKEIEKAKIHLSSNYEAIINIKELEPGFNFKYTLTREKFEELNNDLYQKAITILEKCIKDSGINKSDIDEIILTGGSTHILIIQNLIKIYFNMKKINKKIMPEEAIVKGAVLHGWCKYPEDNYKFLYDAPSIIPLTLGIETYDGIMNKFFHEGIVFYTMIKQVKCLQLAKIIKQLYLFIFLEEKIV